jgi:hypothetical protein
MHLWPRPVRSEPQSSSPGDLRRLGAWRAPPWVQVVVVRSTFLRPRVRRGMRERAEEVGCLLQELRLRECAALFLIGTGE